MGIIGVILAIFIVGALVNMAIQTLYDMGDDYKHPAVLCPQCGARFHGRKAMDKLNKHYSYSH